MICESSYDSKDKIPTQFVDEFENVNGKWVLKSDAIPGAAELLNPGLASNRDSIRGELVTAKREKDEATRRADGLERELAASKQPGGRVLSEADAKSFDNFTKLGTYADVKKKIDEHKVFAEKIQSYDLEKAVSEVATAAGLNPEVLRDWALHPTEGDGLQFFLKDETIKDAKGAETVVKKAYVKVSKKNGDSTEVSEHPIDTVATERLPKFKQEALKTQASTDDKGKSSQPVLNGGGIRVPDSSSASSSKGSGGEGGERLADRYNKQRTSGVNPFATPAAATTSK